MNEKELIKIFTEYDSTTSFWRGIPMSRFSELAKRLLKEFNKKEEIEYCLICQRQLINGVCVKEPHSPMEKYDALPTKLK